MKIEAFPQETYWSNNIAVILAGDGIFYLVSLWPHEREEHRLTDIWEAQE